VTEPYELHEWPTLHEPTLVVMLAGWIDAAGAAAAAMQLLDAECGTRPVATFDADTFIDYRARRPTMQLRDGCAEELEWPVAQLRAGRDAAGHDLLLLTGHEPDAAWRRFADATVRLALDLGTRRMIGLGAYPFAAPHTRPARLSCTTPSRALADSLPFLKSSVDVPAGVEAVLEHEFHARGVEALGIWAQVPHYISAMAYPAASVALLEALHTIAAIEVDTSSLRSEALIQRTRLDQLVAANDDHTRLVSQLESHYDAVEPAGPTARAAAAHPSGSGPLGDDLPSGDELAEELERFLRERGTE
jgi:proteasome assembly chaperone (PAC2) family protein